MALVIGQTFIPKPRPYAMIRRISSCEWERKFRITSSGCDLSSIRPPKLMNMALYPSIAAASI